MVCGGPLRNLEGAKYRGGGADGQDRVWAGGVVVVGWDGGPSGAGQGRERELPTVENTGGTVAAVALQCCIPAATPD